MSIYNSKRLSLLIVGIAILVFINIFFFYTLHKEFVFSSPAQVLAEEEYLQKKARYIQIVNRSDPKVALTQLQKDIRVDNELARSCHILTHQIGQQAYQKYNSFSEAISYSSEVCNSGYMHGVVESKFLSEEDITSEMTSLCSEYKSGTFAGWQCYHGIGHGLMYFTSNDLYESLALCGQLPLEFARSNCANGVYMENFNTEQKIHPSEYVNAADPFYPCNLQQGHHKGHCYYYAPAYYLSLYPNSYKESLKECLRVEDNYITICISGVGGQMMKENINNPLFVEHFCLTSSQGYFSSCIGGMIGIYVNHHGSIEEGLALCEQMKISVKDYCFQTVEQRKFQFL